jgi:pimeloyl-ACP methyl ester carboxylesterase
MGLKSTTTVLAGGNRLLCYCTAALMMGFAGGGTAWELAEQFDVIMPDAQGHGFSDRLDAEFSFDNHTKHVAGLVKELGLEKPFIMGHSMGAGITCSVAMEYPDLPKAIILEDPSWGLFPPKPEDFETAKKNHEAIRAYQTESADESCPLRQFPGSHPLGQRRCGCGAC